MDFLATLRRFTFEGAPTVVEKHAGIPYFVNAFWTAKQRQTHSLHEVSYRACFKPQLPDFFIHRLTKAGDMVYDPFMGRGTTLLQAVLRGRIAAGADANPLSLLLARPRLAPPSLAAIAARLQSLPLAGRPLQHPGLLAFYHPETLAEIEALRRYFLEREAAGERDAVDDWLRMVALSRLTGHSPGFFSVYTLPPNQAVSLERQQQLNARRQQTPPRRDVKALLWRKSCSLLRDLPVRGRGLLAVGDATAAPFPAASVDLVVTSPPFLDVVQYKADNWLRCWFAGIAPDDVATTLYRKPEDWAAFTHRVLADLARLTKSGGYIAYEVGEVRRGKLALDRLVLEAATGLPLQPLGVLVNRQTFSKTANCWGVSNNRKGTNSNRIVVFRRGGL